MHGFADNDVFAASVNQLFHYDGTTWSPVMVPVTRITDVFGTSATDLYVASYSTLAHWNGSAWTTRAAPLSIAKGIAVSPTNLWFVGPSTTPPGHSELVNFDGTFFVTVAADLCSNGLVARGSEIYVCEGDAINPVFSMVTKRPNTLTGTATPYAPARPLESSWFSPDGHLYVPGMMVHAP